MIKVDATKLKWIRRTKRELERGTEVEFHEDQIRRALYRPFTKRWLFMNRVFCEDLYNFKSFFPTPASEKENRVIAVTDLAGPSPFSVMMAKLNHRPAPLRDDGSFQVFPLTRTPKMESIGRKTADCRARRIS